MSVLESFENEIIVDDSIIKNYYSDEDCKDFRLSSKRTRFEQSSLGALFCDAIKYELSSGDDEHENVDLCLLNGAVIKGNKTYADNNISYAELKKELPFPTKIVIVSMPLKVVKDAVLWSRTNVEEEGR